MSSVMVVTPARIRAGCEDEQDENEREPSHDALTRPAAKRSGPALTRWNKSERIFINHINNLMPPSRNGPGRSGVDGPWMRDRASHLKEDEMKKLALAAIAATFALSAVAAPALAQEGRHEGRTVKKVVVHRGDHGRHEGWRHRNVKKVVIHRDRGRHEGWRHSRHYGASKKVVIKHGHGKTVIKKRVEG
jgi:hypothetical protein